METRVYYSIQVGEKTRVDTKNGEQKLAPDALSLSLSFSLSDLNKERRVIDCIRHKYASACALPWLVDVYRRTKNLHDSSGTRSAVELFVLQVKE